MKRPYIQCPQCLGHGEIPMPDGLADVLDIVRQHMKGVDNGVKSDEVQAICKDSKTVKLTAINNRLTHLERLGFIKRISKEGKWWRWEAVPQKAKKDMYKVISKLENKDIHQ